MRKQNKIISLILVVALLCSLVVFVPATAAAAESSNTSTASTFAPTATWASAANANDALSSESDNLFGSAALANWSDPQISANVVTPAGGDKYVVLVAEGTKTTANQFINVNAKTASTVLNFTNGYYVIEMDLATENQMIESFSINPIISFEGASSSGVRLDPNPSDILSGYTVMADGDWHHYAMVGNLATNELKIYIDGNLVATKTAYNATNKGNQDSKDANTAYYVDSIRVNIGTSATVTAGNTLCIDNISLKVGTSSAFGVAPAAESLPAIASVDGVKYSNVNAVNAALNSPVPVKAEILRDFKGTVTVNCDATVETNGCSGDVKAGANVDVTSDGTVKVFDAPFKSSVTETSTLNGNTVVAETMLGEAVTYGPSSNYSDTTVVPYLVTDNITGNTYLDIRPGANFSTGDATHNHFNFQVKSGIYEANTMLVYSFDYYAEAATMLPVYIGVVSRNTSGSNIGGSSFYLKNLTVLPVGEWVRFTCIGDVSANKLYVYVNGELATTLDKGVYNAAAFTEGFYFEGVRVNIASKKEMTAEQSLAIDNFYIDVNSTDAWLLQNKGASSLAGWTNAPVHELPEIPLLATIDGEAYYTPGEVGDALYGNVDSAKKVELYRDYMGELSVGCDAVVNTNGFTVPVAGTGVTVEGADGVYTYDAPYMQSADSEVVTENAAIIKAIKGNKNGNLFKSVQNNIQSANGMKSEIVINAIDGGDYLKVSPNGTEDNAYFEVQSMTELTPNANTQYYILEMDFAILDPSVTIGFMTVPRVSDSGKWGAANPSLNTILAGYNAGEMQHVTAVVNLDTNTQYIYVNGNYVMTNSGKGYLSSADHTSYWVNGTGINFNGYRIGSNLGGGGATQTDPGKGYTIDNVNILYVEDAATGYAADSLTAAIAAGNISLWADATTEVATKVAPLAKVDGEYVYSVAALNNLLSGRQQKKVELLRDEAGTITVNCDATVETNGLAVNIVAGAGVTASANGTVTTYDAPWKSSATESATSSGNFIIDTDITGNLFAPSVTKTNMTLVNNGAGELAMYKVTDAATGNTYLKIQPTKTGVTSANVYLTTEILSAPAAGDTSADCVLLDGQGYYVHDFDIATDSRILQNMTFGHVARNNASEGSTFPFGEGVSLANYQYTSGEWTHVTIVGDLAANKQYVFINGAIAGEAGYANQNNGQYAVLNVKGARINLVSNVAIDENETILLDNLSARAYKTADAADGLAAAISAGSLAGWANNVDKKNGKLPSVATVNGTEYSSVDELTAALSDGKNLTVSLDRAVAGTAYASTSATITTNGIANFIKGVNGYVAVDNGNGTYTVKIETRYGTLTVNINGNKAIYAELLYGTDIAEYLRLNNSYVFDIISDDNGQVYTDANWGEAAPAGAVDGDEVYNVTATAATGAIVVRDAGGNKVTTVTDLKTAITAKADYVVVMNGNYVFDTSGVTPGYNTTIYMAGHTITFAASAGATHAFTFAGTTYNLFFFDGSIIDNVRSSTQAIFYANYDFAKELKCQNVDIYAVGNIGNQRGGTFTFEDCNINMLECQNSYGFAVAEYYNAGYTYNKCTLNLIDSDIKYTHFTNGRTQAFITVKNYTEWGGKTADAEAAAIAKGYDKLVHEINISGCNVNISFGAAIVNTTNELAQINIDNSQLNVKQLYSSGTTYAANINIGDNVVSAIPLTGVTFGEGVIQVNSGNPEAPYAYVNEYATVTWSDGTSDKWVDGVYPSNENCKNDKVEKVEAGKNYTFEAVETVAIDMKANVTLNTILSFNVYVNVANDLLAMNIGGVEYSIEAAERAYIDGVEYYCFRYEMAPYYAAQSFAIAATISEYTVTNEISLAKYADKVVAAYADDANAVNLVKAMLQYVAAAHAYMGVYHEGYDVANKYADATAVTMPTAGVNTMANVSAYITSASLNLSAAPKFEFKIADGASIAGLTITVGGEQVEYTVSDGYVVVELPAYDMLKTITVSVGDATGEYNFAAYYVYMSGVAAGLTDPSTTSWQAKANIAGAEAYYAMDLLEAFYTYASYAQAYKA